MFPYINSSHVTKITSAFYLGFATRKFKRDFLISNISVGNIKSAPWATALAGLFHTEKPVILGGTVKNVIAWTTKRPESVHTWYNRKYYLSIVLMEILKMLEYPKNRPILNSVLPTYWSVEFYHYNKLFGKGCKTRSI